MSKVPDFPESDGPMSEGPSSEAQSSPAGRLGLHDADAPAEQAASEQAAPLLLIAPQAAAPSKRVSRNVPRNVPRKKRRPWLLLALAGAAGMRVCGEVEPARDTASARQAPSAPQKPGRNALLTANVDGPITSATLGSAPLAGLIPYASPTPSRLVSEHASALEAAGIPVARERGGAAEPVRPFELTARPVAPGRTWQDAANASDWSAVALLIDMLPEPERTQPGARYARAVAARELSQCGDALAALTGLESELPILGTEIASLRAHCQLDVGPYEAAYRYFSEDQSPENLTLAARAAIKGGDLAKAEQAIDRALKKLEKLGGTRNRSKMITARSLRADILEARGQPAQAAREWLWLATQVPTDAVGATADETYERLARAKLGSRERLERLRAFARDGQLERTLREAAHLANAPGPAPEAVDIKSALAWAYYHSRADYLKAAELFSEAAELSADTRVKFSFFAARALSRADEDESALAAYRELVRRYPGSPYTEQAHYRIARIEYGRGAWENAERAYTDYLDRYARNGGGQYAGASRYELAIARLGAKERTEEAAVTLGALAKKERRSDRRAMLTHLEAVALEETREPAKVAEAVARYRSIVDELPLSFAAMASSARLRALGTPELPRRLGFGASTFTGSTLAGGTFAASTSGGSPVAGTTFAGSTITSSPVVGSPVSTKGPEGSDYWSGSAGAKRLPEKARFLADIGLHTDAERALFDERQAEKPRAGATEGQELCGMYGSLDRGFRSYALAERLLKRDDLGRLPSSENAWAWRCKYPQPYREIVSAVEARYRLPPSLVHAVMRQESGFRSAVVSPAGAIGLMQLMPNTALRAAEEIMQQPGAPWVPDPSQPTNVLNNVELGGFYLSKLLSMLGGQLPVAVAAYNAGPSAVSSWLAGGEDLPIDVWVARIPYAETRDYVSFVLGNWIAYRYLDSPNEMPELKLAMIPGTRAAPDAY